jgi:hypothetical protein
LAAVSHILELIFFLELIKLKSAPGILPGGGVWRQKPPGATLLRREPMDSNKPVRTNQKQEPHEIDYFHWFLEEETKL